MAKDCDFTVPPNSSTDEKLDLALAWLSTIAKQQAKIDVLEKKVNDLEIKVTNQDASIKALTKENRAIKEAANIRDQEARNNTIRLFGLPISQDEETGNKTLSDIVYNRILKPILTAARAKGDCPSVPHLANLMEECYRVGKPAAGSKATGSPPPPIIIKLTQVHRLAILKHKRLNMPSPTDAEKAAGHKKFVIVEDLTAATHRKLKELQGDQRIEKIWTVNGRLRFVLCGEDKSVKKVKSVFDPNEEIFQAAKSSK